ncbi:MAG: ketosteroid isomerase-related protein [Hyphomicrobiales bacterium]
MTAAATRKLVQRYYDAFNAQDVDGMLDCLSPSFVHDVSQGERRKGKKKFAEFLAHMNRCYREQLSDIVIMTNADGSRAAAEFKLKGKYLQSDEGLPEAAGQTYRLSGGTFFEIADGRIARVSTHYNLKDWMRQVAGA